MTSAAAEARVRMPLALVEEIVPLLVIAPPPVASTAGPRVEVMEPALSNEVKTPVALA